MDSTKNFLTARLCLVLLTIFNHTSGFAATADTNKVSVTDFKYFRKINYKNQQLLVYKNTKIKSIFYLSDKNQQDYIKKDNRTSFNIKIDSAKSNHKISFSSNRLHYTSNNKITYFENANNSVCAKTLEENYLKLNSRSILRSIQSVNVATLIDDKTCTEDQKEKLGLYLSDMLTTENAWLSRCYGNDSVKKLIETDVNYLNYTGSVYSKYLRLVQKINDNEKPIQISCKVSTPGKLGSFDETTNPEKISLDFENLSKKAGNESKLPDAIKTTLGHELFHYGEQIQTPDNPALSSCINESYAKIFTDICTESDVAEVLKNNKKSTTLLIPTSDQITATCAKNPKQLIQSKNSMDNSLVKANDGTDGKGFTGTTGIQGFNSQGSQQQNQAAKTKLKQTVTQSDFTQPSDSDFATLVSNTTAGTTEGKSYTVSANSSFGQAVQNTMNAFANSGSTLTNKLNAAVAATTSTAQATTTTLATTGTTSNTKTGSTYIPTSTIKTASTTDTSNTRMPANIENSSDNYAGKTSLGSSGQPSEMGGGTSGGASTNSFYTGSGNLGNTNAGKGEAPQGGGSGFGGGSSGGASSGGGSSTGSAPSQKTAQQKQAEGSEMVKTIQSLKAFNTVTGGQYQEIKKYYNNPQFLNLLQTYDMRIMVKNPTGQYVALGVDSKKAKKVFNDDGQVLKTVEEKK